MSATFTDPKIFRLLKIEKRRSMPGYAEDEIVFTQEASPFAGRFSFDRTPHLKEILEDRERTNIWLQTIFASTQTSKTTAIFIAIAKVLNDGDGMCQLSIPNDKDVVDYIEQKVDPFFDSIKSLKKKLVVKKDEEKSRFRKSKKQTAGATLHIVGNTALARSSRTIKHMFIDEARLFGKGHIEELIGRTKAFTQAFRKVMIVSSMEKEGDEADLSYQMCDCKKELQTYCKECGEQFYATSKELKYITKEEYLKEYEVDESDYDMHEHSRVARGDVYLQCDCGYKVYEDERIENIKNGKTRLIVTNGDPDKDGSIGYKINALASTFVPIEVMVDTLIKIEGHEEKLSRFYRDYFNETYQGKADDVDVEDILLLSNGLQSGIVPSNTWKLFMYIDNQKDHLYYEVKAYQYGNISNSVMHGKLMGYGIGDDFAAAKEIIQTPLYDEDGNEHYIDHAAIDKRGYNEDGYTRTQDSNDFVIDVQEWAEENGVEDLIFAAQGVDDIRDDKYMVVKEDKMNKTSNGEPIKILTFSNLKMKNRVNDAVVRTIGLVKSQDTDEPLNYKKKLFYINQTIVDDANDRMDKAGDTYRTPQYAYESHLSSEVFDSRLGRWVNPKQRRNDYFDTTIGCDMLALYYGVDRIIEPREDDRIDLLAEQKRFQST